MPYAPPTRCWCRRLATANGRCDDHQPQPRPWVQRSKAWGAGGTRRWRRVRAAHLRDEPNCRACGAPAVTVDHIVPRHRGGSMWDPANHQSLCRDCHDAKSGRERAELNRQRARQRAAGRDE